MKYIIYKESDCGVEMPVIFSKILNHSYVYNDLIHQLGDGYILVSAGFIMYDENIIKGKKLYCYGKSVLLNIGSREEDTLLILNYLKG